MPTPLADSAIKRQVQLERLKASFVKEYDTTYEEISEVIAAALALLRRACVDCTVVGFDVVELLPEPPSCVSDFAAARLIFKILGYLEAGRR